MDYFFDDEDDLFISRAIDRRKLHPGHPAHLSRGQFDQFMRAGIARMKRENEAMIAALRERGIDPTK